jgi:murein DD-endopeptidase MepM/ murein hydrolase activator NlpD
VKAQPAGARLLARIQGKARQATNIPRHLAWHGADVDGDGAPDFVNPTGQLPRTHDAFGFGAFGASRDGGVREHEGVDYAARAGQAAAAPISGFVTKIGYAYGGDTGLRFVEITNPAIGYVARAFYVDPTVSVGQALRLGQTIGRVVSLQDHYPGITDHVHLEILNARGARVDAAAGLITARWVPGRAANAKG